MFEIFVDARRMVLRDEAHLFGECEVEIEDTTIRAITSLIVDVPVRANVAPGMAAVYLLKLLIQGNDILARKRHTVEKISRKDAKDTQKREERTVLALFFAPLRTLCAFA